MQQVIHVEPISHLQLTIQALFQNLCTTYKNCLIIIAKPGRYPALNYTQLDAIQQLNNKSYKALANAIFTVTDPNYAKLDATAVAWACKSKRTCSITARSRACLTQSATNVSASVPFTLFSIKSAASTRFPSDKHLCTWLTIESIPSEYFPSSLIYIQKRSEKQKTYSSL